MKNVLLLTLCGLVAGSLLARIHPVQAVEPFKKEFEKKYVHKEATDGPEKEFAEAVNKAKCNVCHVGTNKKMRNGYGKALSTLLKKTDQKNIEKIQSALDKVNAEKSDPSNANSPTFGELIKQGKLPGGDPTTATASASEN